MTVWNVYLDLVVVWCNENKLKGVLCFVLGFLEVVSFLRLIVQGRFVSIFSMKTIIGVSYILEINIGIF